MNYMKNQGGEYGKPRRQWKPSESRGSGEDDGLLKGFFEKINLLKFDETELSYETGAAYKIADHLSSGGGIKTNQLRKLFELVKKMGSARPEQVKPIAAKMQVLLAYSAGRKSEGKALIPPSFAKELMKKLREIGDMNTDEDISAAARTFDQFFEAVLAYYTFLEKGGKK
jgi:CRISPR type III-A-associated protein Csm2